ncbi:MAG: hypothetical protein KAU38_01390 [Desulfobacterales bacterium]|nr:hypothetical protein [Desulfobacterales bacterium]
MPRPPEVDGQSRPACHCKARPPAKRSEADRTRAGRWRMGVSRPACHCKARLRITEAGRAGGGQEETEKRKIR